MISTQLCAGVHTRKKGSRFELDYMTYNDCTIWNKIIKFHINHIEDKIETAGY
jgi:hypothetical protein